MICTCEHHGRTDGQAHVVYKQTPLLVVPRSMSHPQLVDRCTYSCTHTAAAYMGYGGVVFPEGGGSYLEQLQFWIAIIQPSSCEVSPIYDSNLIWIEVCRNQLLSIWYRINEGWIALKLLGLNTDMYIYTLSYFTWTCCKLGIFS